MQVCSAAEATSSDQAKNGYTDQRALSKRHRAIASSRFVVSCVVNK